MDGGNNPFFGFETIRAAMRPGGRGPTWALVAVGVVLVVLGVMAHHYLLAALGIPAILLGVWPLVADRRSHRDATLLEEHARREDAIVELARRMAVMNHADAIRARPQLVAEVAADPGAARIAREMCLKRAATDPSPDLWLDAAGAIADARTDAPVR
jgi:hypothetical protein